MEKENIHIGSMIKAKMKERNLSPTELAKRLGYSLPGTTSIFERHTMQTEALLKVCKALDYDFFRHYADCPELREDVGMQKELTECKNEIADLKKELEYLKKIVRLYEERKGSPS